jgi:cell division protein FtsB
MAAVATRSTRAARNAGAIERARTHAPVAPRRKSGPVRKPARPVAAPAPRVARTGAALIVDRLLRGRAWVVLVGALLAGIVFLNVSVLELNRGIARTDAKAATLERTNSSLRERVATLNDAERIQRLAEQRGYILPQPGDVTYLKPGAANARLAAQRISQSAVGSPQSAEPVSPAPTVPTAVQPTANATQP